MSTYGLPGLPTGGGLRRRRINRGVDVIRRLFKQALVDSSSRGPELETIRQRTRLESLV